jgi:hypothetical protein
MLEDVVNGCQIDQSSKCSGGLSIQWTFREGKNVQWTFHWWTFHQGTHFLADTDTSFSLIWSRTIPVLDPDPTDSTVF